MAWVAVIQVCLRELSCFSVRIDEKGTYFRDASSFFPTQVGRLMEQHVSIHCDVLCICSAITKEESQSRSYDQYGREPILVTNSYPSEFKFNNSRGKLGKS
jgi:hypothetical protein